MLAAQRLGGHRISSQCEVNTVEHSDHCFCQLSLLRDARGVPLDLPPDTHMLKAAACLHAAETYKTTERADFFLCVYRLLFQIYSEINSAHKPFYVTALCLWWSLIFCRNHLQLLTLPLVNYFQYQLVWKPFYRLINQLFGTYDEECDQNAHHIPKTQVNKLLNYMFSRPWAQNPKGLSLTSQQTADNPIWKNLKHLIYCIRQETGLYFAFK